MKISNKLNTQKMIVVQYPSAQRTPFHNRYTLDITENRRTFTVRGIPARSGLQANKRARRHVRSLIANAIDNEL